MSTTSGFRAPELTARSIAFASAPAGRARCPVPGARCRLCHHSYGRLRPGTPDDCRERADGWRTHLLLVGAAALSVVATVTLAGGLLINRTKPQAPASRAAEARV
jgi:hypothetical protein